MHVLNFLCCMFFIDSRVSNENEDISLGSKKTL